MTKKSSFPALIRICLFYIAFSFAYVHLYAQDSTSFHPFPLQSIKPAGWLLQQLQTMAKGSTGQLDEVYDKLKNDNGWLGGKGDGWEETPYWLDGAVPLAYLLNDTLLQQKVLKYINWTLSNQRASGYFGPVTNAEREKATPVTNNTCNTGEDWWPKMIMLKVLQQYYDATGDKRVIVFMSQYFAYQLKTIADCPLGKWTTWSQYRGVENVMMVNWLYGITKEPFLLELSDKLTQQSFGWTDWFAERTPVMKAAGLQNDERIMERHSVNVAMGLKFPALQYELLRDRKYLAISKTAFSDLMLLHGLPMGIFSGDEDLHGNGLHQGTELCTIVETMYSLEKMLSITGDVYYMDALERMAFNALPAQTSSDYNLKQYFQLPNQVQVAQGALAFSVTQYNGMSNVFGTKSGYTCCYANMHQGWTKFAAQLWHATNDGGIANLTYAPSELHTTIAGNEVHIQELTDYPFENRITFRITSANPVSFPWKLRIPSWCKKANIFFNNQLLRTDAGGQIVAINQQFKNGDELSLEFPMEITTSNWANNSRTVERGPLVYALKVKEEWKRGVHEQAGEYYSIYPKSPWNYGLVQDSLKTLSTARVKLRPMPAQFTWDQAGAPIEIVVSAKAIPSWKLADGILYQPVCDRSGVYQGITSRKTEYVTLIPYGCTKLRIVAFPVIK